ncbi:MAG TPA: choice-of-anchor tandem repeat NxxGxxAF-containing protein, partial [Lacipirellulaceae bacterium]|nr:choice-of-anchor tandem repeat NxxGxxAF-containing protein [Lacipirellulaceae bacterium]
MPVALSGVPSPAGGNYTGFGTPVLNAAGEVAFYATLSTSSATGIFAGNVGSLQTVALRTSAAPGGGTYTTLNSPFAMNSLGQVAFDATTSGGAGIFAGAPGSVQSVARIGAVAPGGSTYRTFNGFRSPVLNDAGQVAFYADLGDGTSTNNGVFVGAPGAVQLVAKTGTSASIGGTFSGFLSPVLNGAGQIAVIAGVTNGGSPTGGLFLSVSGSLQPIALDGTAAPAGGNYHSVASFPGINSAGQVVFISFLNGGSSTEGIFSGGLGSVRTVALRGDPAPSGGVYDTFFTPLINSSGMSTFRAETMDQSFKLGLFEGAPGAVQTVALSGDSAPGGAIFSDFTIHNAINGSGLLVFGANLSGPG